MSEPLLTDQEHRINLAISDVAAMMRKACSGNHAVPLETLSGNIAGLWNHAEGMSEARRDILACLESCVIQSREAGRVGREHLRFFMALLLSIDGLNLPFPPVATFRQEAILLGFGSLGAFAKMEVEP